MGSVLQIAICLITRSALPPTAAVTGFINLNDDLCKTLGRLTSHDLITTLTDGLNTRRLGIKCQTNRIQNGGLASACLSGNRKDTFIDKSVISKINMPFAF